MISRISPLQAQPQPMARPKHQVSEPLDSFTPAEPGSLLKRAAFGVLAFTSMAASAQVMVVAAPQANPLDKSLSKLDPGVVQLLQQEGLTMQVVRPGTPYAELGVHMPMQEQDYRQALPEMRQQAERVKLAARPFDAQLQPLLEERASLGPQVYVVGRAPTAQELRSRDLDDRIAWLKRDKRQALSQVMSKDSLAQPFRIPSLAGHMGDSQALHELVAEQSKIKSVADMARAVGAKTPEQIRLYSELVEGINGPVKGTEPNLLVPDLYFMADGRGGHVLTRVDGAYGFTGWADASGRTSAKSQVNGQYFPWANRILVQAHKVSGTTPSHELGHAIEESVARRDPRFYNQWIGNVQSAYQRALSERNTISEYARTNLAEYIAEGVAHYQENPAKLRAQDPRMAEWVGQLLSRAAQLGGLPAPAR